MLSNFFIIMFLTYYTKYILTLLFSKKSRESIQKTNTELNTLRKIPVKSLDEQKEFLNKKYPKKPKFKFKWKMVFDIFIYAIPFLLIIRFYYFVFDYFGIELKLWQSLIIIFIFPLLINLILQRFNLEKNDLVKIIR